MKSSLHALVIIDMQNDFVLPGAPACITGASATIPAIKKVLEFFRANKLPVFHVIREYRADGSDVEITRLQDFIQKTPYIVAGTYGCKIVQELAPIDGEYQIIKNRFSGFMNTELDLMLRRLGVTDLVVCGTQYPVCMRTTIFDAVALGYRVTNVTDASSAQTPEIANANIVDIKNIGVSCLTVEGLLKNFKESKSFPTSKSRWKMQTRGRRR